MSEKMMICPKHATCDRTCKEIGRHCGPHTKTTGCEHGANFCPPCVPVKVKQEMRFRKKPVVIEAVQFTGDNGDAIAAFMGCQHPFIEQGGLMIGTLEGVHRANPGDWIIKGVKGEFYPCKPDIFAQTYEPAEDIANAKDHRAAPVDPVSKNSTAGGSGASPC